MASGVIVYVISTDHLDVLLLQRLGEVSWDWPKGIVEPNDRGFNSLWTTAKRELLEETSIDLSLLSNSPRSPYWYEYQLSDTSLKKVCLFPVRLDSKPEVTVSGEHAAYSWIRSEDLLHADLPIEQRAVFRQFLSDIKQQSIHAMDRTTKFQELGRVIPGVVTCLGDISSQSWYWYGSWLANEQATYPQVLSDIDLVCYGSGIPNQRGVAENRETIKRLVEQRVGYRVSCSVHYVECHELSLERSPQWSYFAATRVRIAGGLPGTVDLDVGNLPLLEPDKYNEIARLCWYRLYVHSVGSPAEAAYSFAKGLLFLPILTGAEKSGYSFVGYKRYFDDLISSKVWNTGGWTTTATLDILLRAIDEKMGNRSLSANDEWRQVFCQSLDSLLPSMVDTRTYEGQSSVFCRACLAMIHGDLLSARNLCLALGSSFRQLPREMQLLPQPEKSEELRLAILCFLGVLRVLLWPKSMKFASDNVAQAISSWSGQLTQMRSVHGVSFAHACARSLRRFMSGQKI